MDVLQTTALALLICAAAVCASNAIIIRKNVTPVWWGPLCRWFATVVISASTVICLATQNWLGVPLGLGSLAYLLWREIEKVRQHEELAEALDRLMGAGGDNRQDEDGGRA